MPNELELYNTYIRANLPSGVTYDPVKKRYWAKGKPFLQAKQAIWYNTYSNKVMAVSVSRLFAAGEQGVWYDPSDLTTLFADTAGTTPATVGNSVALMRDKSGRGNHATQVTAAARPILRQSGGLYYLEFDGIDDLLTSASVAGFGGQFFASVAMAGKTFGGLAQGVTVLGGDVDLPNRASVMARLSGGTIGFGVTRVRVAGGTATAANTNNGTAWLTDMNPHIISGGYLNGNVFSRGDGVDSAPVARADGLGTFSAPMRVGQGANAAVDFYGGIYRFGDGLPTAKIVETETWLKAKAGIA